MRNNEAKAGEILEQIAFDQLHECDGIGGDIICAGRMQAGVTTARNVDHRGHIEFDHLFVERIPICVGQWRRCKMSAAGVGVEVTAYETHVDAALQFGDAALHVCCWRLRQHANRRKDIGIQLGAAFDKVVIGARPGGRDTLITDMRCHRGRTRRENRHIRRAFFQQTDLVRFQGFTNFIIGNSRIWRGRLAGFECGDLCLPPCVMHGRCGGVMAVAINNQCHAAISRCRCIVPLVISGCTPKADSVLATSSISAARRCPCVRIRSRL